MKINVFKSLAIAAAAVAMSVSCENSEVKTEKAEVNIKEQLTEDRTDSVSVTVNVEYPVSGIPEEACAGICNVITETAFGSEYAGMSVQEAAEKWAAEFVSEYRETNRSIIEDALAGANPEETESNALDNLGILTWENILDGQFTGRYGNVASYTVTNYAYTGGAHGSTAVIAVNVNLETGKQVTEEDLFIPGYEENLSEILTSHLRDAMPDQDSYDALFVKDIRPNGNFTVSDQGVTYIYGQYEIGPYYLGIISVTAPWSELVDLIRG